MSQPLNLEEYEAAARTVLPAAVYDYYAGGAEDEETLRANRRAYSKYVLRPRVLVDVSRVDPAIEVLGTRLAAPVLIAPTAFQRLAHGDGELATVRAAAARNTIYIASTVSTTPIEQITAAAPATVWFQLYVFRDREITRELVARAEAAGCRALCLTVTVPVQGKRERDVRNRFALPDGIELANFVGLRQARLPGGSGSGLEAFIAREFDPALTWEAVDWLAANSRLPLILKGITHPADARRAAESGAAGVIVSNHGGRQLDGAIATLDALPEVVDAIGGRVPVLLDGGIRRGTDVLKALALGAAATLIGRPVLWGLALAGQAGVEAALSILYDELSRALALSGCPNLHAVSADLVRRTGQTAL
ncbi:MAG TPA: alpha-hydroxy acid oxidase [Longimicrobiales bacterium]|nr:alpha-hydroxy acid oxidase [Longimicrobiales bacterium]